VLSAVEKRRLDISKSTDAQKKSLLGQFLTPERVAGFMASMFLDVGGSCCLLDAGAGIGSLSAAFLDRCLSGGLHFGRIELDAYEIDQTLHSHLNHTLDKYRNQGVYVNRIAFRSRSHPAKKSHSAPASTASLFGPSSRTSPNLQRRGLMEIIPSATKH